MFKFLILAGGAYLVYRGVKTALGGMFGSSSAQSEVKQGEAHEDKASYRDEDVIDVDYREIKSNDDEK